MECKFVALDLDGTTLNSHHCLSDETITVLRELSSRNITVCIATGRSSNGVINHLEKLQLSQPQVPLICFNGSCGLLYDTLTKQLTTAFCSPIEISSTRALLKFASDLGLVAQYYDGASGDVQAVPLNDEHRHLLGKYAAATGRPQVILQSYDIAIARSQPVKLLIMTNDCDSLIEKARKAFPPSIFHIIRGSPDPFFVEFLPPDCNKGSGLQKLCDSLNVSRSNVIAFGDGENDREMLAFAQIGVAMLNAKEPCKLAANIICEWTNDENGVAKQLRKFDSDNCFGPLQVA